MKLVIRTVVFHALCIVFFTYIYLYLSKHFKNAQEEFNNTKQTTFIDFLLLSTTIQAGVGFSNLFPISYYAKLTVIIQQLIIILTHVITLYIFTL